MKSLFFRNIEDRVNQLEQKINELNKKQEQIQLNLQEMKEVTIKLEEEREKLQLYSENLKNNNQEMNTQRKVFEMYSLNLKNNNQLLDQVLKRVDRFERDMDHFERGMIRLQKECENSIDVVEKNSHKETIRAHNKKAKNEYWAIDYLDFENHFRGSREKILMKQQRYIPYFKEKKKVLDIGCGRGEFLELLQKEGIAATGVDTYEDFVLYCKMLGLDVVLADGLEYLETLDWIDGIFAGQVVEHLTTEEILKLCDLAYKKLRTGSYLIIETPNPRSLLMYTNAFYIDPSHIKPVHPLTMEYFLKKSGFNDIQIVFIEDDERLEIPLLKGSEIENLEEFNAGLKKASDMLYGSQDYAIIARKE